MSQYRFVANGSFVDFFDRAMLVRSFPENYTGFTWFYDENPGISFSFEGTTYHTDDLSEISFDGVELETQAGFKTALGGLFPSFAGGNIYSVDGALLANRNIDLDGKTIGFSEGDNYYLLLNTTPGAEGAKLSAYNTTAGGNDAVIEASTSDETAEVKIEASFNSGEHECRITGTAGTDGSVLEYIAERHFFPSGISEFANNAAALSGGLVAGMLYHTAGVLKIVL